MARRFTPLLLFVLPLLSLPLSNGTGASALLVMAPKQPFTVVEVLIPGGTFQMGTNEGYAEEAPAHQVTLDSFYLGRYEVTVAEFKAFVKATGYKTDAEKAGHSTVAFGLSWEEQRKVNWRHDALGKRRRQADYNHPVLHVSWNDASQYCQWLARKTGLAYRLPTEAEGEYAAGNGARHTLYSWGDNCLVSPPSGNVADLAAQRDFPGFIICNGYIDGYSLTAPVGTFPPNDLGLYDMTGNVWEWCSDWFGPYTAQNQTNPQGPSSGTLRVVRGGSWYEGPNLYRVTFHGGISPDSHNHAIGFRLARTL